MATAVEEDFPHVDVPLDPVDPNATPETPEEPSYPGLVQNITQSALNVTKSALNSLYNGVADNVVDQEKERLATELAKNNSNCLIPNTSNEFYDCCSNANLGTPEMTCEIFGYINIGIILILAVVFLGGYLH